MTPKIDETTILLTEACSFTDGINNPKFSYYYTENFLVGIFKISPENFLVPCIHSHDAYEFIIPLSHITCLISENSNYIGEPNFVYPVQSGRTHGIKYQQNNVSHIDLTFEKNYFESMVRKMGGGKIEFNTTLPYSDSLHDYIKNFRLEFCSSNPQDDFILRPLRDLICAEIIRLAMADSFDSRTENSGYAPGISLVIKYINDNFDRDINVDELAKICGFSKTYFSSTFKNIFGTTPKAYVNTLRISKAKNMLEFSDTPIKKIAVSCGFKNLNTFFCAFKKSTDMTPSEFKSSRKENVI